MSEGAGTSQVGREVRANMKVDSNGILLEDFDLGNCSPSLAGEIVMKQSINGWTEWKTKDGDPIDIYRKGGK